MTFTTTLDSAYTRGRSDALRGLKPSSQERDYLRGWESGHKRRNRGIETNVANQAKAADESLRDRWGVKRFKSAKRCPACGTNNTIRHPVTDTCLGCVQRAKGAAK